MQKKIILGIDPGTTIMGYGIISCMSNRLDLVTMGVIQLRKYEDQMLKLRHIFHRSLELVENYKPDVLAIEAQYFGKNVQSMLKLGRAQGISISAALYRDVPVFEYAPRRIKQAVTGNGSASKEQVAQMLIRILNIKEVPEFLDATDALAVAVTHYFQGGTPEPESGKKYGSWDSFVRNNPGKVK